MIRNKKKIVTLTRVIFFGKKQVLIKNMLLTHRFLSFFDKNYLTQNKKKYFLDDHFYSFYNHNHKGYFIAFLQFIQSFSIFQKHASIVEVMQYTYKQNIAKVSKKI